jgi:hypothetical protein
MIPIIAAANRRRAMEREEEEMTGYTREELEGDWEFKIVRAETPVFRKREVLERLLEREAVAGWTMVEKLDNNRVRFKRLRSARAGDDHLPAGVDPYRTQYGGPLSGYVWVAVGLLVLLVGALVLLAVMLAR